MFETLVSLAKSLIPNLTTQYLKNTFGKEVFIDRVHISKNVDDIIFDVTTSSNSDQDIILLQLTIAFLNKQHQGINGPPEITSEYQNNNPDDFEIQKTERGLILKSKNLLEKQKSKSANRFTFKWPRKLNVSSYKKVECFITYSIRGKKKDTNQIVQTNPLFNSP